MSVLHIDVGHDFAPALGWRYRHLGPFSGEEFREDRLEPIFDKYDTLVIDFDHVEGYTSSFLEETFGGLVRKYGLDTVKKKVKVVSLRRPHLLEMIDTWMNEAATHKPKR